MMRDSWKKRKEKPGTDSPCQSGLYELFKILICGLSREFSEKTEEERNEIFLKLLASPHMHVERHLRSSIENEPGLTWNRQMLDWIKESIYYRNSQPEGEEADRDGFVTDPFPVGIQK